MADSDLETMIEQSHRALGGIVTGDAEPLKALYSHREDVSLANPFGPVAVGWSDAAATMERAAERYRDGEVAGFERLASFVTPDLACVVEMERYEAKVGGSDETSPIALRVTSVLRPEEGTWKIVHRHADPITTPRPPESVIQS